jgi:phosphosulfolactate synthase (CoM biosynthesis protein A)
MLQEAFEITNEAAHNEIHFYFIDQYGQRVRILNID